MSIEEDYVADKLAGRLLQTFRNLSHPQTQWHEWSKPKVLDSRFIEVWGQRVEIREENFEEYKQRKEQQ